ncbi:hypothetical protein [uncultured Pedobacter sp.]|uniref:hypothetical protein n=1 Tax=uncultured Pedobacter sp. TaxID=246139 RepID=UPI00262C8D2F|nr:hypothetical protein [uncultured Pedobacter sp.]
MNKKIKDMIRGWLIATIPANAVRARKIIVVALSFYTIAYFVGLFLLSNGNNLPMQRSIVVPNVVRNEKTEIATDVEEQVRQFRKIMDSLELTSSGRQSLDSILTKHPGIMDTVAQLERIIKPLKQ